MTYYSLRMTLPKIFQDLDYPDPDSRLRDISLLKKLLKKKVEQNASYSCGYECLNKFGEPCDPHIHFNFVSDCHKESLRRWLTRTFRNMYDGNYSLKGNSMYKLDSYAEPDDFNSWFGYPLKECPVHRFTSFPEAFCFKDPTLKGGPIIMSVKERHSVAKALMLVRHQKNREYREKAMEKQTFYDKLKKFLDGKWLCPLDASGAPADVDEVSAPSAKTIWLWTLEFYRVCHKPLNMCTVDGYVRLYMWETDLITPESLWALSSLAK